MLASNQQYKSNVIQLQPPPPPEPRVGERITFMRNRKLMVGIVWGTIHTQIKRYRVDGVHPVVCEFVVEVESGGTNLRFQTVDESDVVWSKPITVKCERCNDLGYLSITGDEAQNCPCCNAMVGEVVY